MSEVQSPRLEITPRVRQYLERKIRAKWKHDPGRAEYECFRAICGMHTVRPRSTARRVSRCIGTWIETYCYIKTKAGVVEPITMNPAQRRFLAGIMRRWRVDKTAEVIVLKPRQTGFSTFSELLMLAMSVLHDNENCCVMGNKDEVSIKVKRIFRLALSRLPYDLPTRHNVGLLTEFEHPHNSILSGTSSKATDPGHGDTLRGLHLTEVARWADPEDAAKGIMNTVPQFGRVAVIWESTANGAEGYFYNIYWDAVNGISQAIPLFIAWYEHPEYKDEVTEAEARNIIATLDDEEQVLLEKRYFVRKHGWKQVDVGQLAWRRRTITDPKRCHNDLDAFHEQYPSTAEEAFLSSGRPVFDLTILHKRLQETQDPIFSGDIDDLDWVQRNRPDEPPQIEIPEELVSLEGTSFAEQQQMLGHTGQSIPIMKSHGDQDGWPSWLDSGTPDTLRKALEGDVAEW